MSSLDHIELDLELNCCSIGLQRQRLEPNSILLKTLFTLKMSLAE
jgi:hypothetical protein